MARSAKTNHVMSLVGEKSKGSSPQKDEQKTNRPEQQKNTENSPLKMFNPALLPIGEERRPAPRRLYGPEQHENAEYEQNIEEKEKAYINHREIPQKQEEETTSTTEEKPEPQKEPEREKRKNAITAIVLELINQELEAITKRFHIAPTDSNLWQLTKAALETIRPEFSRNSGEYEEKCGRLRQKVILEMTKAAIRISKSNRK